LDIKKITHFGRFKDIIVTLLKYGLDDVVERLDIPGKVLIDKIRKVGKEMSTRERIRHVLEDLGPTFIKFGQLLSLRPDLVPYPLILELRKLQDEVPPVPFAEIKEVVEKNLRRPVESVFSRFDEEPIAAASLAQVHKAVLKEENRLVAVKVRRPKIRRVIEMDLYIMEVIAQQLVKRMKDSQIYDFPNLVAEIKIALRRELDFTREVRNMKIFLGKFGNTSKICVPGVYEQFSNEQVITMELIHGKKLKEQDMGVLSDYEILARRILHFTLKQIIEDGFFHADPHPGNIIVLENNDICMLDWGMVGRLTRETRYEIVDLINAIIEQESEKVLWIMLHLAVRRGSFNPQKMQREIEDIMDETHSRPLREINVGHLMLNVANLLRENQLQMPADQAMMIKALLTAEGTARQLYPDLNVMEEIDPYIKKLLRDRWHPEAVWNSFRRSFYRFLMIQKNLPARVDHIFDVIEHGELNIRFQHENLGDFRRSLESSTNRLTFGIIIGALVIGSSMIITTGIGPLLFGFPALGIIGYLISGILGLWLIFNIIRRRKL